MYMYVHVVEFTLIHLQVHVLQVCMFSKASTHSCYLSAQLCMYVYDSCTVCVHLIAIYSGWESAYKKFAHSVILLFTQN